MITTPSLFRIVIALLSVGLASSPAYSNTAAVTFSSSPSNFTTFYEVTRGWEFTTSAPIYVIALGVWDEGADGLTNSHEVGIWNDVSTLLVSTTILAGNSAPLVGTDGFRFTTLVNDLLLAPGKYRIGSYFSPDDEDTSAYLAGPVGAMGLVNYLRPVFIRDQGFSDPTGTSAFSGGNFAANFLFTTSIPVPATVWLLGPALAGLTGIRWRRRLTS